MMKNSSYLLLLLCFCLSANFNQGFAQNSNFPSYSLETIQTQTSCAKVVSPDSAYGFVRILERENSKLDIMQVNVEIELQIADHEPCSMTKTTPVELHFPEGPFSLKLNREKGQNQFQFSIHRKRLGPVMFMKGVNSICLAYDREWVQPTWC